MQDKRRGEPISCGPEALPNLHGKEGVDGSSPSEGLAQPPLLFPGRVRAQGKAAPADPFVILLKGLYQPVVHGPNLGLSAVDLSDGSYSTTKIYPRSGTPGNTNQNKAIGDFYVPFVGDLCAYHIPGGSFAMRFTGSDFPVSVVPDGEGGQFLFGTFELDVIEGTGIYLRAATTTWTTDCTFSLLATVPAASTNSASASSAAHNTSRDQIPQGRPAPAGRPP